MSRKILPLNFKWRYTPEFTDELIAPKFDDKALELVDIPHANKEMPLNYFDERDYQFVSGYRKSFSLPTGMKSAGKRILLHFEGIANCAEVYLNGKFVGEHKGGYTAFVFDVTDVIRVRNNVLTVKVDSTEREDIPPFGNVVDYLCFGGIYREVWLESVNETYIDDIFVRTKNVYISPKKLLDVDITFSDSAKGDIKLDLCDGNNVIATRSCKFEAKVLNIKWQVSGVKLWDIENPNLYTLRVTYNNGEDEKTVRFGFRECEFRKDGFFLNGKKVKIRGLNRHQSYPYVGYAMPASAQIADADTLKYELGCNLVRTSHYPDSIHFLDRCDEIGLLVFTEMPSWQYTGADEEWRNNCIENVRRMVLRDRNHPSIIIWGVRVNEGQDCDELYEKTNAIAHALDDTRPTGGVRNFPQSHLLEDVYTYNDFIHSGGKIALNSPMIVAGPSAPYLVTEHNGHMYPTKSFDNEETRTEHALRHARVLNAAYGNPRTSGAIGWCMADYNTHKDFGSGDRICYHGVLDIFRMPKLAASFYKSQQDKEPVLEVSCDMNIGEHPANQLGQVYAFTNCDYVKLYKNGVYMSTAYPNKKKFPNLPHPPVFADDFIGDALTETEKLNPLAVKFLKPTLVAGCKYGLSIPIPYFALAGLGIVAGGMKISDVVSLVEKYIGGWGDEQVEYRFEGYIDDKLVKTVVKTAVTEAKLQVKADKSELVEDDTYDVTRITLRALDQNGNHLPLANNHVSVKTTDGVEVIGPADFALIGGARAVWVRTTGKSGKATVSIETDNLGSYTVELDVKKN